MANKIGFDFDEFGGNVDIVIVETDRDKLTNLSYLKSLPGDWQFQQLLGQDWTYVYPTNYLPEGFETLARELSQEFSTKAIYFYFGDASGWMGYKLFTDGEESEEYSFGISYEEEMMEMGIDLEETRKEGTVVVTNKEEEQFIFWSRIRSQTEDEICSGEKFIDQFLRIHKAYIGWDLYFHY